MTKRGELLHIHRPQEVPDPGEIEEFRQPIVRVNLIQPQEYVGAVMKFCQARRGIQQNTEYLSATRMMLTYDLPLAEVIYDMHDKLKSITRGYGTMDYDLTGYFPADLVRLDIMVNGKKVDALSVICHRADAALFRATFLAEPFSVVGTESRIAFLRRGHSRNRVALPK